MKRLAAKYRFGFTLVELLVVISIIALLLAVLMPALSKAREQGRKIQCAAHMRGMALGMQMYSMTYKNLYPAMLMPGNLSTVYKGKSHWHQLAMSFADNKKLLQCPSLRKNRIRWDNSMFLTGFGLNYDGCNWKYNWVTDDPDAGFGYVVPEEPRGGCVSNMQIGRQGEFIMLGDSNGNKQTDALTLRSNYAYGILGSPRVLGKINPYGDMPDVHDKGGNIAFMDTHIAWYKTSELMSEKMLYMWRRGNK
jgi:prepilin-type N-terminal cleavage/methylation domain-containing protein/prepilin-type processing-associated H-X9-DG protein